MNVLTYGGRNGEVAVEVEPADTDGTRSDFDWQWVDIEVTDSTDPGELTSTLEAFGLDSLAISDAMGEENLPKLDDFGDHLHAVLHGVASEDHRSEDITYEIVCFLTASTLVTVRHGRSLAIEAFSSHLPRTVELSTGGACEVFARLADVVNRRYLGVLDDMDDRVDVLTERALEAAPDFLEDLTELRDEVRELRRALRPQRDVADALRRTTSTIVSEGGRRRFADVFDIAERSVRELEGVRSALNDALGAYQGAEARKATDVTKVLTIYAAVVLPLSLIAGIFGMNFVRIPGSESRWGWWIVIGLMAFAAIVSLGLFALAGWIRPPIASLRQPRQRMARDHRPVELDAAIFRRSTTTVTRRPKRR